MVADFKPLTENIPSDNAFSDLSSVRFLNINNRAYPISTGIDVLTRKRLLNQRRVKQQRDATQEIPRDSPVYPLLSLQKGWDGHWASPPSEVVLLRAQQLLTQIDSITGDKTQLPSVRPSGNDSVAFTWSGAYPSKELEVWLYDQSDYYAEWMLSVNDSDHEGTVAKEEDLLSIVRAYHILG
jgi:hypothetical protein